MITGGNGKQLAGGVLQRIAMANRKWNRLRWIYGFSIKKIT